MEGRLSAFRPTLLSLQDDAFARGPRYRPGMWQPRVDRLNLLLIGDVLIAAVFTAAAESDIWVRGTVEGPRLTNAVLLAFVGPPLVFRRRWPSVAALTIAAAITLQGSVVGHPPSGFLYWSILIVSYSLGANAPASRRPLAALAALVAAYAYLTVLWTSSGSINATAIPWMLAAGLPWLLGQYMRRRRAQSAALAEADRRERERDRQRLVALEHERGRMARELHDLLAHSVSLMGVQAGAAEEVLGREPERARPLLRSIQQTSRDSVAELRRLLGMLRAQELEPELAPQPGLDQLDSLVARMREAGLPVELHVIGGPQPLPAGVELTAYRVVQEALTNAMKHARPSRVEVVVSLGAARLDITVENDGVSVVAREDPGGHGLIGMSERISLYGGRFLAGVRPGGAFRVDAEIPLEAASA